MKQPVQGVEQDFIIDRALVSLGLVPCHSRADDDFPVGKRDHVGLGWIVEEVAVDAGHGGTIDEDELDFGQMFRQGPGKEWQRGLKLPQKRTNPNWYFALLV